MSGWSPPTTRHRITGSDVSIHILLGNRCGGSVMVAPQSRGTWGFVAFELSGSDLTLVQDYQLAHVTSQTTSPSNRRQLSRFYFRRADFPRLACSFSPCPPPRTTDRLSMTSMPQRSPCRLLFLRKPHPAHHSSGPGRRRSRHVRSYGRRFRSR
jgi:hypothetical protein